VAAVTRELRVTVHEKSFAGPDGAPRLALRDVDFRMRLDELVAIVGPSGAGKTTLLKIIAGLDRDFVGSVQFTGAADPPPAIGFVFQEPRLLPWRTVFENIALVLPPHADRAADRSAVTRLLGEVGLAEFADALPPRLSLGMARRVALARALAVTPDLLLMDEPLVSLDRATAERLRGLLLALWRARPCGVVFVTHDLREAVALADRILLFSAAPGRLVTDVAVPLARDRRTDAAAIEAACAAIAPQQDRAAGS
jgi:ABC-type nitrate/sulfonate/bicarbonate transport system ATPase subunit